MVGHLTPDEIERKVTGSAGVQTFCLSKTFFSHKLPGSKQLQEHANPESQSNQCLIDAVDANPGDHKTL